MVSNDNDQAFLSSSKSILYKVDLTDLNLHDHLLSTHSQPITDICFPAEFSAVFATCAGSDIRVWNVADQKELLRIDIAQSQKDAEELICNCIQFMSDGKSIVSGWSDGNARAFTPQTGTLLYMIDGAHKL